MVKKAVWRFENDKSPGPDGFSMSFYKECWEILKGDIMKMVEDFYTSDFLDVRNNATFISLIPKKEGADRMKEVLILVISPNQSAFIGGRQSLDGVLVANECIDSILKNGDSGVLSKLDMEKAYDRVNWKFLDYMLGRMGFGIRWMRKCHNTISFSILLNGAFEDYFFSSQGLRQGDPLSPFLFIVVAKAFGVMLSKAF